MIMSAARTLRILSRFQGMILGKGGGRRRFVELGRARHGSALFGTSRQALSLFEACLSRRHPLFRHGGEYSVVVVRQREGSGAAFLSVCRIIVIVMGVPRRKKRQDDSLTLTKQFEFLFRVGVERSLWWHTDNHTQEDLLMI